MIRQVMEGAGLTFWPVLSFVIFLTSCAFMLAWLYRPGSSLIYGSMARMALDGVDAVDGKDAKPVRAQEDK